MPTQVQFRRGTSTQNNTYTGASGELTIDTSTWNVRLHDGVTPGGHELRYDYAPDLAGGATGSIPYQTASSSTDFIPIGAANTVLTSDGTTASWVSLGDLTGGGGVNADNLLINSITAGDRFLVVTDQTGAYTSLEASTLTVYNSDIGLTVKNTTTIGGHLLPETTGIYNLGSADARWNTLYITSSTIDIAGNLLTTDGEKLLLNGKEIVTTATVATSATNIAGGTLGSVPYQSSEGLTSFINIATTSGWILTSNGTIPQWQAPAADIATTATNINNGEAGQIPIQIAPGLTTFISSGTEGQLLQAGISTATFVSTSNIYVNSAVNAEKIFGGTAGQLVYQSASGTTAFANSGTSGQFLQATTNGAPVFTSTGSMYVANSVNAEKWLTPRTFTFGGDLTGSMSVDGSQNVTFTATIAADSVALGTDTTGNYVATGATSGYGLSGSASTEGSTFTVTANSTSANTVSTIVFRDGNGDFSARSVTLTGDLVVQGTTFTVNSTVTNVSDPIFTIGGDAGGAAPSTDDNKDRGIAFQWHNGSAAKIGFFGYDDSTGYMTFVPDATISNEVVSGTVGTIQASLIGNVTGTASTATNVAGGAAGQIPIQSGAGTTAFVPVGTSGQFLQAGTNTATFVSTSSMYVNSAVNAEKWLTARTFTFGGDLSGSMVVNGSQDVTFTATIAANSVALGTDTTGDYVSNGATSGFGLSGSTTGESQTFTVTANSTSANTVSTIVYRDASGNFSAGVVTATNLTVSASTNSTSTTTGALQINNGGAGIGGNVYVGGVVNSSQGIYNSGMLTTAYKVNDPATAALRGTGYLSTVSSVSALSVSDISVTPNGRFLYSANLGDNTLGAYTINTTTGVLTNIAYYASANTRSVVVHPNGKLVYNATNGPSIIPYTINQATGALTAGTAMSQMYIGITAQPYGMVIHPSGRFLYAANGPANCVSQYSINQSTGALTTLTSVISVGNNANAIAMDPTGRFVYVKNQGDGTISQLAIDQTTGYLSTVTTALSRSWTDMTFDPSGRYAFVNSSSDIYTYSIDQTTGALTQVFSLYMGVSTSSRFVADPLGRYLFGTVATLGVYSTITLEINQRDGSLRITGMSTPLASDPSGIAIDPTGRFVFYGTNFSENVIKVFAINNFSAGQAVISAAIDATNTQSGALQVVGGLGVGKAIYAGGNITAPAFIGAVTGTATTATNVAGGSAGQIPIQSGAGTTAFVPVGTSGQFLQAGTNTATFVSTSSMYVNSAVNAETIFGGTAGQLVYQSGAGTTAFAGPGSAGQILVSAGTSAPTYTSTSSIYVNNAVNAEKWLTARTFTFGGDLTGSMVVDGSQNVTFTATIAADSVALGTDTTGNYVATGATSGFGLSGSASTEGSTFTVTANSTSANTSNTIVFRDDNGDFSARTLTLTGDLVVQGTTVTVNSTITNVSDPIFTIGSAAGGAAPSTDDNKDRGIAFQWHNGSAAKIGFFGYDDSTGYLTFVPDATINNEVVSGSLGTLDVTAVTGSASKWTTARTFTFGGDLTGSMVVDGNQDVTFTATIAADSVALGTDTTGNYVATGATSGYGLSGSASTEGSTFTITANSTSANTVSTIVYRDDSGNFSAGTITATAFNGPISGTATTATNVAGGSAGQIPIQSAAGTTAFIPTGTSGQFLQAGTNTATFVSTSSMYVNSAVNAEKWLTARTFTFGGDLTGSMVVDGSQNVTFTATIAANSVALGTDTTGDYVSNGATSGFGLSGSTTGESQTFTVTANSTSANTVSTIVYRDASGNFSAGVVTATNLTVSTSTNSTSTTTGALQVAGGAGIGGNVYVGGVVNSSQGIYNSGMLTTAYPVNAPANMALKGTGALSTVSSVSAPSVGDISVTPNGRFVYSSNLGTNSIGHYTLNTTTGVLTLIQSHSASNTRCVVVHPNGKFVYGGGSSSNSVAIVPYTINQSTGALTTGTVISQLNLGGSAQPLAMKIHPSGRFLYSANGNANCVTQYSINQSTGALTTLTNAISVGNNASAMAMDPTGRFLYVRNQTDSTISQLAIDQTTGYLSTVTTALSRVWGDMTFDPSGRYSFVSDSNRMYTYSIDQTTGALTQVTFIDMGSSGSQRFVADPLGRYLYGTTVLSSVYSTITLEINQRDGSVRVTGHSITLSSNPEIIAIDPTGRFLFIGTSFAENLIKVFAINNFSAGQAVISAAVDATSTQTGALQVVGGLGVGAAGYFGGNVTAPAFIGALTGTATTATNVAGGSAGQIPIQSAAGTTAFVPVGTSGQFLQAGTNTATFVSTSSMYVNSAVNAEKIFGGTAGQLVYQSGAGTTAFAGPGTAGQILVSAGTSAPTYTNTSSIYVNNSVNAEKWLTPRTFTFGGDLSGSMVVDGSQNVTFTATIAADSVALGTDTTGNYVATGATSGYGLSGSSSSEGGTFTVTANSTSANTANTIMFRDANGDFAAGGANFSRPVTFSEAVTFNGTATFVLSTNTVYTDNIVNIHIPPGGGPTNHTWTTDDGKDIGFIFHYYKSATDKDAFLGFANDTTYLEWYSNGTESGGVFTGTTYGTFKTGSIILVDTTGVNSTNTGALQVTGGVGVGGSVFVGGTVTATAFVGNLTGLATTATNVAGGTAGQLVYQSAPGATAFAGPGTAGQILVSAGTSAPTYTSTSSIYVNNAVNAEKWLTPRTFTFGGDLTGSMVVDGSQNVTFTATIAADSVALGTDTTGNYVATGATSGYGLSGSASTEGSTFTITANSTSANTVSTIVYRDDSGNFSAGTITATAFNGPISGTATTATNVAGGSAGQIPIQSAAGTTAFIPTGTSGQFLQAGTNTATFVSTSSMYVNSAVNAEKIFGGTAGQLVYQSGAGTTAFAGPGTAGQILVSAGTSAPTYTSTSSIYVNNAVNAEKWLTSRTFTFGGDLTGSMVVNGSQDVTFTATIAANSVALGTDTTGDYVSNGATSGFGLSGSTTGESQTFTVTANSTSANTVSTIVYRDGSGSFAASTVTATSIVISGNTASTSTNTGALTVSGGVGIGGSVYVGGTLTVGSSSGGTLTGLSGITTTNLIVTGTSVAISTITGALQVAGGIGVGGGSFFGGIVTATTFVGALTGTATTATNIAGGAAGQLHIQSAAGATAFVPVGTAGQFLQAGTNTATFVSTSSMYVNSAVNAEKLYGGTAGQLVYQSAAGTTAFAGPGTAGQILVSAGTSAPTYTNTSSIYVNNAVNAEKWLTPRTFTFGGDLSGSMVVDGSQNVTFTATIAADSVALGTDTTGNYVATGATSGFGLSGSASTEGSTFTVTANSTSANTVSTIVFRDGNGDFSARSVTLTGDLVVQGTTFTVNSTITNVSDPIFTIGGGAGGAAPSADDNKDRGIAFQWHNGVSAKVGFFGYDDSTGYLTFVPDATISNEVVSGTVGTLDVTAVTGSASKWTTARTFTFGGDLTGSMLVDGSQNVTFTATIAADSVALGTDTTGNYVATGATSGYGLSGSASTEGSTFTVTANSTSANTVSTIVYRDGAGNFSAGTVTLSALTVGSSGGGTITGLDGITTTNLIVSGTNVAISTVTGALQVVGGIGVGGGSFFGGIVTATTFVGALTGTASTATNVAGGAAGQIPIQSAAGATAFVPVGTSGQFLQAGTNTATFVSTSSIYVNSAVNAEKIFGGTAGQLVYQSAAGVTAFAGPGTAGNVLVSNGTSAPTYNNTLTLTGSTAVSTTNSGALQVVGGVGIGGGLVVGGITTITNTTAASSTVTGALQVVGGAGIGGSVYIGGTINVGGAVGGTITGLGGLTTTNLVVSGTSLSNSTITGALQVVGGIGVGGGAFFGGIVTATTFVGALTGTASAATNVAGGTAGQIIYQSGVGATAFAGPGTAGQILVSAGTSAPTYTSTSSIYVNNAVNAEKWLTARTFTFGGDLTGSMVVNGSQDVTFTATIAANSVALGTDTTGDYVSNGATSGFGLSGSTTGESQTFTVTANSTSANTVSTIVYRDGSSGFAAGVITATNIAITATTSATNSTTGVLQVAGGVGVGNNLYVAGRIGWTSATNISAVYQIYNTVTNSLDTIFG